MDARKDAFDAYVEDASNDIGEKYERIKKQADGLEASMDKLYTVIQGMSAEENAEFMKVYDQFNALLVEFQDMTLTVQQAVNA